MFMINQAAQGGALRCIILTQRRKVGKGKHLKQLFTHIRLANKKMWLLINFSEVLIKIGIKRVVNGLFIIPGLRLGGLGVLAALREIIYNPTLKIPMPHGTIFCPNNVKKTSCRLSDPVRR